MKKRCSVCKKEIEIIAGLTGGAKLALHGPGKENEFYCRGSNTTVKVTPKQRKSL